MILNLGIVTNQKIILHVGLDWLVVISIIIILFLIELLIYYWLTQREIIFENMYENIASFCYRVWGKGVYFLE